MTQEKIPEQTSNFQPIKETPEKSVSLVFCCLSLALTAVATGAIVYSKMNNALVRCSTALDIKNREAALISPTLMPSPSKSKTVNSDDGQQAEVTPTKFDAANKTWKTYKSAQYGFEFKYPEGLIEPAVVVEKGETGYQVFVGKPGSSSVDFDGFFVAGESLDYSAGRSGWIADFQGYKNENGKIKLLHMTPEGPVYNELPKELVKSISRNSNGVEVVTVIGKDNPDDGGMPGPVPGTAGEGRMSAMANTNNKEIPGIVFVAPIKFSEADFMKIVESIKIAK